MTVARPWRAIAYVPDWTAPLGRKRAVAGRTSAKTRAGLDRFIAAQEAEGNVVDVIEVLDLLDEIPPDRVPSTP